MMKPASFCPSIGSLFGVVLGAGLVWSIWTWVGELDLTPPRKLPPVNKEFLKELREYIAWHNGMSQEERQSHKGQDYPDITATPEEEYQRLQEYSWDKCLSYFWSGYARWRPRLAEDDPGPWNEDAPEIYNDIAEEPYLSCVSEIDKMIDAYGEERLREILWMTERNKLLRSFVGGVVAFVTALLFLIAMACLAWKWRAGTIGESKFTLIGSLLGLILGAGVIWSVWMTLTPPDLTPTMKLPEVDEALMRTFQEVAAEQNRRYEETKGRPGIEYGHKGSPPKAPWTATREDYVRIQTGGWESCVRNFRYLGALGNEFWKPTEGHEPWFVDTFGIFIDIREAPYRACAKQIDKLINVYGEQRLRQLLLQGERIQLARRRIGMLIVLAVVCAGLGSLVQMATRNRPAYKGSKQL